MLLPCLIGWKFNLTYVSSSDLNCGSRILYICHEIGRGFKLLVIAETPGVPLFAPTLHVQCLSVWSSSLTYRNLLWGCESCSLESYLLVVTWGQSSLGCSFLWCCQGARPGSPGYRSYKLIFIYNPGESLSSLPGALACIMLLWGWFILLVYSNLNGLLNTNPLSLQPKLSFPFP